MRRYIDEATVSAAFAGGVPAYKGCAPMTNNSVRTLSAGNAGYVRLEIRSDTLYSLIHEKALVIEDLRGLDGQTKKWIKQRLLETLLLRQD